VSHLWGAGLTQKFHFPEARGVNKKGKAVTAQLSHSVFMTLFFSICIYVHTRSSFINTSCPVIIMSGWNLRWRRSHAYLDLVCFSDEATFHACGDINNQIKSTFQMSWLLTKFWEMNIWRSSCYISSSEEWISEGQVFTHQVLRN